LLSSEAVAGLTDLAMVDAANKGKGGLCSFFYFG